MLSIVLFSHLPPFLPSDLTMPDAPFASLPSPRQSLPFHVHGPAQRISSACLATAKPSVPSTQPLWFLLLHKRESAHPVCKPLTLLLDVFLSDFQSGAAQECG